jgi:hypothetical protein
MRPRLEPGYEFPEDGPRVRAEWKPRAVFHEVAEALGIETTDIMAATGVGDRGALVLYSTHTEDIDTEREERVEVHRALLERGADGVFRVVRRHRMGTLREFLNRVEAGLGPQLHEETGP